MRVRRSEYVEAAFGSGGPSGCPERHVLPNSLTSVIALAALQFGSPSSHLDLGLPGLRRAAADARMGLLIARAATTSRAPGG